VYGNNERVAGPLFAAVITAVAVWLSRSVIGEADGDPAVGRIGFVRPFWELAALVAGAALLVVRLRPRGSYTLPFLAAALLILPWLPGPIPGAFMVWTDGLVALVWLAIGVGVVATAGPSVATLVERQACLVDARRAPMTAGALAFVLAVAASQQVAPRIPGGDEPHYLVITQTLLNEGHLRIETTHRDSAYRAYYDAELRPHYLRRGQDGEIYSIHAPGLPALLMPAFAAAGYPGAVVLLCLIAAAGTGLAWRAAFIVTRSAAAAWFGWAAIALSAPFFFHSFTIYPDIVAAVIVLLGIWPLITAHPFRWGRWMLQGSLLAFLPWLHTRYSILAITLAMVALVRLAREPDVVRRTLAFLSVPLVSAALWLAFFHAIYGTADPRAPYGSATQTALANVPSGVTGLLVDQQFGILSNAPVYAVAALGLLALWRHRRDAGQPADGAWLPAALLLAIVPYVIAVTSYAMWWGGWSAPGRFAVPTLLPLAITVASFWRWPMVPGARPLGLALLVGTVFITGVLALVDRGSLLYDVRGPRALWLDWISPSLDVALAWPSLFRDGHRGALLQSIVWLMWMAGAWAGLAALLHWRKPGPAGTALATSMAMAVGLTGALATGRPMAGDAPRRQEPSAMRLLRQVDVAARPMAVSYRPLRLATAGELLPHLTVTATPERGDAEQPLFRFAHLPAGRYRLRLEADADVTDRVSIVVGRERHPEFIVLNSERQALGPYEAEFDLPVDVHSIAVYGEATAREGITRAVLQPVGLARPSDGVTSGRAARAWGYDGGAVFFLDDETYVEPTGLWVKGGREAGLVITAAPEISTVRLLVRNGAQDNTVELRTGAASTPMVLAGWEERVVEIPAPQRGSAVLVRVRPVGGFRPADVDPQSEDDRWLGCWIEIR
jgi:hypothetical protein